MIPKYYITTQDDLVRFVAGNPNFTHNWVMLENGELLVRVTDRNVTFPPSWQHVGHVLDHEAKVSNEHCMKLRQHGVLPTDTPFRAVMRVAKAHPDMEP